MWVFQYQLPVCANHVWPMHILYKNHNANEKQNFNKFFSVIKKKRKVSSSFYYYYLNAWLKYFELS